MRRKILIVLLSFSLILFLFLVQNIFSIELKYHSPAEVSNFLKDISNKYPSLCSLSLLGKSTGGQKIFCLEIAAGRDKVAAEKRQAVLVTANVEGLHLPGTEAALALAEKLLSGYGKDKSLTDLLDRKTVYIVPLLNPDAAAIYFSSVKYEKSSNDHPVDEDNDGLIDEDGPEDLNKDGLITMMRVKSPDGRWIIDPKDPRLMKLADSKKGEKGGYQLYTEGLDNDGDGLYNEDGPGGVELNRNFPHDFEYFNKSVGLYPVSEPETEALLKFMFDHKNIALVINFSTENNLLNLQQTGQARVGSDRVRVPRQFATFLGLDPDTEYSLKEIMEILKSMNIGGGMEIDESMVATFLGLDPAVTIDRQDMPIYEELQKEYKDGLKEAKLDFLEKRAKGVGKGSLVAFCYYQYGVPVFSFDLWQVPEPKKDEKKEALTPDKLKSMTSEEFLALGEEKIAAFLKDQGAPPNFSASLLINMVKSGQVTPAKMAEMMEKMPGRKFGADREENPEAYLLAYSDNILKGQGFVPWKPFKHPTLGEVEIGGFVPYLKYVPPAAELESTIKFHTDFCLKLMFRLAELRVKEAKAEKIGPDLYKIKVYLTNDGWLPTSTAQGRRALTAYPIRARLKLDKGQNLIAGRPMEMIPFLGSGDVRQLEWVVQARKNSRIKVEFWSNKLNPIETVIALD